MSSADYELIKAATLAKQQVVADYHEHRREMSPHVVGWKNGREKALLYQFAGTSSSGLGPLGSSENWRCVFIDELQNVVVRDGDFYTAAIGPRPGTQTCADQVDAVAPF